jgi:uncharacterized sulfatase
MNWKVALCGALAVAGSLAAAGPNIIWLVGEDFGPEMGCYGDRYARTPHLDRFSGQSVRFIRAFTHAPVCAPSRSGLITGRYPTSIGTHHMRSKLLAPPPTFTSLLRRAGYHVAWPGKTDFNFDVPKDAFDTTSNWLRNPPPQPFFAYLNFPDSHESKIRASPADLQRITRPLAPEQRHDPAKAVLPPYYPDAPEVRRDWANYHDVVSGVDHQIGEVLRRLDELGLNGSNTVVFFFGDHGRGLPRGKRWVYDSGIHVPLLVRWPGRLPPGTVREDLVSFVDLPATVLALAGVPIPPEFQGQVFLGPKAAPERKYVFAARDRMDETYDRIRAVRDKRFKYIRNFHPELPYAQRIQYMELMPTMRVWREWHAAGKLAGPSALFFAKTKPAEELYDLDADPHEVNNLASAPAHATKLQELRRALDDWMAQTKDLGGIPETELIQRGLVADKLKEYEPRVQPLPEKLKP